MVVSLCKSLDEVSFEVADEILSEWDVGEYSSFLDGVDYFPASRDQIKDLIVSVMKRHVVQDEGSV